MNDPSNAPHPLEINDRTIHVAELTDKKWIQLDNYIRQQFVEIATNAARTLGPIQKKEYMAEVSIHAAGLDMFSEVGIKIMSRRAGIIYIGWLMCTENYTLEQFTSLVASGNGQIVDNLVVIYEKFTDLHLQRGDDKLDENPPMSL